MSKIDDVKAAFAILSRREGTGRRTMSTTSDTSCEHCGRPAGKRVELELDWSTGLYRRPGEVAEDKSQGIFMIGARCAQKLLRETAESEGKAS